MSGTLAGQIHRELHARIAKPVAAPCRVRHSAYLLPDEDEASIAQVREGFRQVLQRLEVVQRDIDWGERSGRVEVGLPDGATLRIVWELHTQFYSYTTFHFPPHSAGNLANSPEQVPPFAFPHMPSLGTKIVDLDIVVLPGIELTPELQEFIGETPIYGGLVLNGESRVWTNFKIDGYGQARYLIRGGDLAPGRLGQLIRRLVEIENYYHLILMPLEEYRERVVSLREMEQRVVTRGSDIYADLAQRDVDTAREHRYLVYLTRDLAELMQLTEHMRHKLSAATSYYAIFEDRIHWLRERTGEGFQSIEEFLTARIAPAILNYNNFIKRADGLTSQITLLGNMMRTRVSLTMEGQSLETMQAMKKRVELQLLLQRTVEGLSLIVLTYYMTGLAGYVFRAVANFIPLPGGTVLWSASTIPIWLLMAFWITRRVHKLIEREAGK